MAKRTFAKELKESLTVDKGTLDSYNNFVAKLGLSTQNLQTGSTYSLSPFISRVRILIEAAYRSSWLVGQVVDTIAEDMTREGITMNSKLSPDDINILQGKITDFSIFHELCNAIKWARLYGGAIAVIMTEGADYSKPLNYDAVGKGRFKGLLVFDRWMLDPSFGDLITEVGSDMGRPKYYTVVAGLPTMPNIKIHHSRCIRFDGIELPYYQRLTENLWGLSVIERMYDRLIAYDSATAGASQLLYKAHLRVIKVEGLREALALGGKTETAVIKQFNYIRLLQATEGITVLDAKDDFAVHPYSFSGISDLLQQFGQQISGATGIPLVRLFGQSPAGLSSTGESDLRNYYDHINKLQEYQMRSGMRKILDVMSRSELGKTLPEDFTFDFTSLWQMSDTEKATIASNDGTTISNAFQQGIITKPIALKELSQQSHVTGRFTNITEEDIENAAKEPSPGEFPTGAPPETGTGGASPSLEELKKQLDELDSGKGDEFDKMRKELEALDVDRTIHPKMPVKDRAINVLKGIVNFFVTGEIKPKEKVIVKDKKPTIDSEKKKQLISLMGEITNLKRLVEENDLKEVKELKKEVMVDSPKVVIKRRKKAEDKKTTIVVIEEPDQKQEEAIGNKKLPDVPYKGYRITQSPQGDFEIFSSGGAKIEASIPSIDLAIKRINEIAVGK